MYGLRVVILLYIWRLFSIPETPFVWRKERYYEHIESVLSVLGEYLGKNKMILKGEYTGLYWVKEIDEEIDPSNVFDNSFDAISYFMEFEPFSKFSGEY